MARQKKTKFVSLISWLLLLLLLVGGIGVALHFAGIGKDDITDIIKPTFRIECNENIYKSNTENIVLLPVGGRFVFKVKNGGQYSVKITPYTSCNFTLNGEKRVLDKNEDITEFILDNNEVGSEYFALNCDEDYLLKKAIKKMCGSSCEYVFSDTNDYTLKLFVTAENGELITIKLRNSPLRLDRYEIIF